MAEKKGTTIIIKKKKGGHAAAHGGAWKVAYADFVTAMMCFFLVMWLMGADEETKASIAHYFNNPSSPFRDASAVQSKEVPPMGERNGAGESILNGLEGAVPEDLVTVPNRTVREGIRSNEEISELAEEILEGQAYAIEVEPDYLKFSIQEELLFERGQSELRKGSNKYLDRLGQMFKGYPGYVTIDGHTDDPASATGKYKSSYEFSLSRSVSIMNYFIDKGWMAEEKMQPLGSGGKRGIASNGTPDGRKQNRRVEFTMTTRR